jgi:hypothetical protein
MLSRAANISPYIEAAFGMGRDNHTNEQYALQNAIQSDEHRMTSSGAAYVDMTRPRCFACSGTRSDFYSTGHCRSKALHVTKRGSATKNKKDANGILFVQLSV